MRSWKGRGTASPSVRAAVLVRGRVLEGGLGYRAGLWNPAVLCAGGECSRDSAGDEVP